MDLRYGFLTGFMIVMMNLFYFHRQKTNLFLQPMRPVIVKMKVTRVLALRICYKT